ncbi:hypothetical protein GLE_0167 [Lysobacter enzymogenes]|uniref:Uncharacterized protein n=1 Tax=Lysobacter enzymogenes TaxID=69 RepID=A0A0S2DAF0_LYSEN|nr:hypothetical protein GLE_0167 [Lysobacter enzymogenes]
MRRSYSRNRFAAKAGKRPVGAAQAATAGWRIAPQARRPGDWLSPSSKRKPAVQAGSSQAPIAAKRDGLPVGAAQAATAG